MLRPMASPVGWYPSVLTIALGRWHPTLQRQEPRSSVQVVGGGSGELSRGYWLAGRAGVSQGGCCFPPGQDRTVASLGDTVVVWGDITGHCMPTEVLTPKLSIESGKSSSKDLGS